jgi:hypothetical protein
MNTEHRVPNGRNRGEPTNHMRLFRDAVAEVAPHQRPA